MTLGNLSPALPLALRNSTLERLRFFTELGGAALAVSELLHWIQAYLGYENPQPAACLARWLCLALTLRCRTVLRDEKRSPAERLFFARCWLGAIAVGIAFIESMAYQKLSTAGVSRVCLAVTLTPILIPDSLKRSMTYSAMLLSAWPLGYCLALLAGKRALPGAELGIVWVNNLVAVSATWLAAATVHQMREQIVSQFGSYRLVKKIGSGAFGDVWEGAHRHLRRPAAIKLIKAENSDAQMLERFWREAATLSSLECPHTVRLLDYGSSEDGTLYLAMEMLNGLNLEQFVQKYGAQPQERVVALLSQACLSLEEAHGQGLIHRDIKPANLFLCKIGSEPDFLKVLDFGLVKPLTNVPTNLTADDHVLGTPDCMSPEQITTAPLDARSDLYSLGCVGYYLLTGGPVFPCKTLVEFLTHHLYVEPQPLSGQTISPELEALIMRCLSKDPADRPQSAHELYKALQTLPQWQRAQAEEWWAQKGR